MKATAAPGVIVQDTRTAAASRSDEARTEERNGVLYVVGPDGIAQPCASLRIATLVAASVRNLRLIFRP